METTEKLNARIADDFNKKGALHEKKQEFPQARDCYEKAGHLGSARGWTNLGTLYGGENLGDPDLAKAYGCFSKAAAGDHERGKFMKAKMLGRGQGVIKDIQVALELLKPLAVKSNFMKEARALSEELQNELAKSSATPVEKDRIHNHKQLQGSLQIIPYDQLFFGQRIGAGFFGEVFKGTWQRQTVAIKTLQICSDAKRDLQQELLDEAAVLYQLNSPLVTHLYGLSFNQQTGVSAMVMEFVACGNLSDVLKKQTLSWSVKISLSADVAMGLGYLHENDILHRDLKATNVLVDKKGNQMVAKIGDFGLAKKKRGNNTTVLNVNPFVSTNRLPHELRQKDKRPEYTKQADVHLLGMLFIEIGTEDEPDLQKISADTPPILREQIAKCCSHNPDDRPEAYAVAAALENVPAEDAEVPSTGLADSVCDAIGYARTQGYLEYQECSMSLANTLKRTSGPLSRYARAVEDTDDESCGYAGDPDLYQSNGLQ